MTKKSGSILNLYELDDCKGKEWGLYSQYFHLYFIAYDGENAAQILPFSEYGKELLDNYGSITKAAENLQKYYPGSGFYYLIDDNIYTREIKERLRLNAVKVLKGDDYDCFILEKKYYTIADLPTGKTKEEKKQIAKARLKPKKIYLTKDEVLTFNKPNKPKKDYQVRYLLSFQDILKIRENHLEQAILSEENLTVYNQRINAFDEISLDDAFTINATLDQIYRVKPSLNMGSKIYTYYEFDPLIEKNPGYGDTIEVEKICKDGNGNQIFQASQKIVQNENDFEYALRIFSKGIRVFSHIPDNQEGDKIIKDIIARGLKDRLHEFTLSDICSGFPGIVFFREMAEKEKEDNMSNGYVLK